MPNRSFLRNIVLVLSFFASAIILSAQVNREHGEKAKNDNRSEARTDTVPVIDNTEGLTELNKIIERYQNADLSLVGEIYYYDNVESSKIPEEKSEFELTTVAENSSYEIDSVRTIINGNLTLIVDRKEESMSVFEQVSHESENPISKNISGQLSEFLNYISSIEVKNEGDKKTLVILFNEDMPSAIDKYEITYDAKSYRIKKIRMEMTDGEITDGPDVADSTESKKGDELVFVDSTNKEIETGYYGTMRTVAYEILYKAEKPADKEAVDLSRFIKKIDEGYVPVGVFKNYEFQN
jgi:hypothetical protein